MDMKKNISAKMLEKIARTTAKATADSRCVCILHQPKMPADLKKFNK